MSLEPFTTIFANETLTPTVFTLFTNYHDATTTVPTGMVTISGLTIVKPIGTVHFTRSIVMENAHRFTTSMETSDTKQIAEQISVGTVRLTAGSTITNAEVTGN